MATDAYPNGQLEREIVLSRVVAAPRDVVFAAWSEHAADVPVVRSSRHALRRACARGSRTRAPSGEST